MEIIKIKQSIFNNIYQKKLNVAAYVRVSTKLECQITSIKSQTRYYKDKIERNDNWKFVGIYSDYGITGTSDYKRKDFMKMMKDARKGKIDYIITKSISRFSRNTIDSIKYVRELKKINVGVYFEEEKLDTLDMKSEFLLSIFSSVAQLEAYNISERLKLSFMMKLKSGEKLKERSKLFGYNLNKEIGLYEINPKEAEVVKLIFELYLKGMSFKAIATYLNENHIFDEKNWNLKIIKHILKNERYIGNRLCHKVLVNDNKVIKNYEKVNQYLIRDANPAIIDTDSFEKVQAKIKLNQELANSFCKSSNKDNIFYSNVRCGYCGVTYILTGKKPKKSYNEWSCSRKSAYRNCKNSNISEETLKSVFNKSIAKFQKIRLNDEKNTLNEISLLNNEIEQLSNEISKYTDRYINKKINRTYFNKNVQYLNEKIVENENRKIKLTQKYSKNIIINEKIRNIQEKIKKYFKGDFSEQLYKEIILIAYKGEDINGKRNNYNFRYILKDENDYIINTKFLNDYKFEKIRTFKIKERFINKTRDNKITYIDEIKVTFEFVKEEED